MFTYKTHNYEVSKEQLSRIVTVVFTDGKKDVSQTFRFAIEESDDVVKRTVKKYLDELNVPHTPIAGDITDAPPEPEPEPPTQAELDKPQWDSDREKLRVLMELVRDGVFSGDEKQITDLKAKVRSGFKVSYLN